MAQHLAEIEPMTSTSVLQTQPLPGPWWNFDLVTLQFATHQENYANLVASHHQPFIARRG